MDTQAALKEIRSQFPGKTNAALRAALRDAVNTGDAGVVRGQARRFALTASGRAGLEAIARLLEKGMVTSW